MNCEEEKRLLENLDEGNIEAILSHVEKSKEDCVASEESRRACVELLFS